MTKNIPICHSKIRITEWIVEFLIRYLSHQKWWTPTNGVVYTKEEKASYKVSRDRLLSELYTTLTDNIGDPGDMLTGNAFKIISSDQARTIICGFINKEH